MGVQGQTIGFVGLGLMGRPMCRNLLAAGANVVVWNRSPEPLAEAVVDGATAALSPADVTRTADIVIIMVADTIAVGAVLNGDDGIIAALGPDNLIIDMGTTAVTATRGFAAAVREEGGAYVDAPVSGGTLGAESGELTIMAGGEECDMERARPVFDVLGTRITHVGGVGSGQVAKAANQVIVGLNIGAVAEALMLARHAGADPAKVRDALQGGFADSRILEVHGQRMIENSFAPGGKATTQLKDLTQALDLAAELGIEMPATALGKRLYERLVDMGDGGLDHAALIKALDPDYPGDSD